MIRTATLIKGHRAGGRVHPVVNVSADGETLDLLLGNGSVERFTSLEVTIHSEGTEGYCRRLLDQLL